MDTKQSSYLEIPAQELAKWLDRDPDCYWTVDGDPVVCGKLSLPSPGDELSWELRKINKPLEVFDRRVILQSQWKTVTASELADLVETEELGSRVLQLRWEGCDIEWLLIEDEETSESVKREAQAR